MLLSLYASLRWARKKHYVLKISIFVILASLLSTILAVSFLLFIYGPFPVLSFPFYGYTDKVVGPTLPGEDYGYWIRYYQIHFLTREIYSVFPIDYRVDRVTFLSFDIGYSSLGSAHFYDIVLPFMVFISVNLVGASLGFLTSKINTSSKRRWRWIGFFGGFLLGIIILGFGIWLLNQQLVKTTNSHSWIERPYLIDAFAFVPFGITWLVIVVGERLARILRL